ncbi:MAG: RNA methyltransferase [bacterium]
MIERNHISIVLVEPAHPANIGAAARAMKNMGFHLLRLVRPADHLCEDARRMAMGSQEILEHARVYPTLGRALSDLHVTVGCTARKGKERVKTMGPEALAGHLGGGPPDARIGIVFGREDSGLTNRELDLCNILLAIPTAPEHSSLNLAQAVLVVCYELMKARPAPPPSATAPTTLSASSQELEELYQQAREVLLRIGFLDPANPDRILRVLRRTFGKVGLDPREVRILKGILRQMNWYAGISDAAREEDPERNR